MDGVDRDDAGMLELSQQPGFRRAVAGNLHHHAPLSELRLVGEIDLGDRALSEFLDDFESQYGVARLGPFPWFLFRGFGMSIQELMHVDQALQRLAIGRKLPAEGAGDERFARLVPQAIFFVNQVHHQRFVFPHLLVGGKKAGGIGGSAAAPAIDHSPDQGLRRGGLKIAGGARHERLMREIMRAGEIWEMGLCKLKSPLRLPRRPTAQSPGGPSVRRC